MRRELFIGPLAIILAGCGNTADDTAPPPAADHSAHMESAGKAELTPAQQAYAKVNDRMHAGMAKISDDADVAFIQGMLAHHRGAVEMSQVALEYGTDEQARNLAQRIIDAQQAEIDEMEAWLAARENPARAE